MEISMLILTLIAGVAGVAITVYFWCVLPARMARKRGRSEIGWVLLAWCISPLWVYILLAILGDTKEKIKQDILDEIRNND